MRCLSVLGRVVGAENVSNCSSHCLSLRRSDVSPETSKRRKFSNCSSRCLVLVTRGRALTKAKRTTKAKKGPRGGGDRLFVRPLLLLFLPLGVRLPCFSFLASLHRMILKVCCVSLPPVTSPTSVLTKSLHSFVCSVCNRGYPEPTRIGSSAGERPLPWAPRVLDASQLASS